MVKEHGEWEVKLVRVLIKKMTAVLNAADQFTFTPARWLVGGAFLS